MHISLCEFKVYDVLIWNILYHKVFITIRLINISFTSYNYYFAVIDMMRTSKLYSKSNFQVYNKYC